MTSVRRPIIFVAVASLALSLARGAAPAFGFPGLPGLPGLPSLQNAAQSAAYKAALANFGASLASDVPIASSANAIFPTVASLPGRPFSPQLHIPRLSAQLRASGNGTVTLAPGDYQIAVDVFCMHLAAHSPAGHRYLVAPLQGSMADVVTALNANVTGSGIPHGVAQVLSWNIQNGVPYGSMPPNVRAAANRLVPKFLGRLQGDPLARARADYENATHLIPGAPSFDDALGKLGDPGAAMLALESARQQLQSLGSDADAAMRAVSAGPASGPAGGPATPWSRVSASVYERLITAGNFATPATLQIRVVPAVASVASLDLRGLGPLAQSGAAVPVTNLVGDPQNGGVQPLSAAPQTPDGSPASGNSAPANGVSPPAPPAAPHANNVVNPHPVDNCQGAANYINNNPDGVASADINLVPNVGPVNVTQLPNGQYQATTSVSWSVSNATVTMPQFSWPGMTAADANALSQYYAALLNHEEGHVTVAQQYAADQGTATLTGTGATPAAAKAALKQDAQNYQQQKQQGLDNETNAYDEVTGHGATQSDGPSQGFPGGPNVVLNCP